MLRGSLVLNFWVIIMKFVAYLMYPQDHAIYLNEVEKYLESLMYGAFGKWLAKIARVCYQL
jgi:hypothetical protein